MLYLGRKRIASGGGTTTVTAHQFTNNVSDIKPDGASASLGVLDTIVRADHVHPITIATLNSLGVVKPNKALGTSIDANGNLSVETANASEIASRASQFKVIYTGNLNNSVKAAFTDANHLTMDSTEQATAKSVLGIVNGSTTEYGLIKIAQSRGLDFLSDGGLFVDVAGDTQITNRTVGRPIAAGSLNFAVKSALTDANHLTMTTAEQATARSVIGVDTVERLETIYDKDSQDAAINQGLTSGVDFPNSDTANYVSNCTRSKYKGLYLLFSSESTGTSLYVRVYVPNVGNTSRFGFVAPYQGDDTLLYWGHGMWNYDRLDLLNLRECYQTTTTVSASTRYKLIKVEGVLA